jgi:hypothetical protein
MKEMFPFIAGGWLGIGIFFVAKTRSRGWKADLLFVFTWPFNAFLDWRSGR